MFCRPKMCHKILAFTIIFSCLFFGSINLIFAQKATGGDNIFQLELDGKIYWIHEFKSSGTFIPQEDLEVQVLVVAGGGNGGAGKRLYVRYPGVSPAQYYWQPSNGGGGGGGGVVYHPNYLINENISQSVVIGLSNNDSQFDLIIAKAGGNGGTNGGGGLAGGSGGGGSGAVGGNTIQETQGSAAGGLFYGNKGNDGRKVVLSGYPMTGTGYGATGGGAGGGAAGIDFSHIFGIGVGVNGVFSKGGGLANPANNGVTNSGNGGDGASGVANSGTLYAGGAGGSGVVLVRYLDSNIILEINQPAAQIISPLNSQFSISGVITYDQEALGDEVIVSATLGGIERQYAVTIGEERENLPWHLTWTHDELTEGEYTNIEFTATSNSSTPEETTSTYTGKIIIDKTAPVCGTWNPPISSWRPRSSKSFTLSGSTDAGGSGIDIGGGVCNTGPNHGDQCVLEIKDQAGNTTLCPSPVNNIDIFPPQLQVTPPLPGWQGNKQSIIIEPSDDKTGIKRTAYSWLVNNLGSDCTGGDTYNPGDDLRLTIMGGENTLYTCTVDNAGNTTFSSQIYRYIPPILTTPKLQKNVKPSNLYWNIESISETQSYVEIKGFFPKTKGNYNYALELIIPTINKSYSQALQTSPFSETHFTILIPTSDFNASKDNHTFSGPQKLKITDLDEMESTTTDLNLTFFFPIHQSNHRKDFNYFILAGDNRLNEVGEP